MASRSGTWITGRPSRILNFSPSTVVRTANRHVSFVQNAPRRLDAVEARQVQVDQHEIRFVLPCEVDGLQAVACIRNDFVTGVFEHETQVRSDDRIVVDGENASCRMSGQTNLLARETKKDPGHEPGVNRDRWSRYFVRPRSTVAAALTMTATAN